MARILRHNDESVREGYIRNGCKEIKLFTSALKAYQCNNRIVIAQKKRLDDFYVVELLDDWNVDVPSWKYRVNGTAQSVICSLWQRFQDDGNVSRCNRPGRPRVTTPNEDRYIFGSYCQKNRQTTASDLSRQLSSATSTTVSRQTVYRCLGTLVYMLVGLPDVFHLPQLTVTCD
ncbi:HTH_Tnp_Tc3_2 domain-containing protein [Trichonephila clavipes]|nr:HTH_Tnp_Tc3_2 domain-containing protein [Trichonephila clavipes]